MPKLAIKHKSIWNRAELNVFLNNRKVGTIMNGSSELIDCENGTQSLVLRNEKVTTNTLNFDIKDNQIKTFKITGFSLRNVLKIWLGLVLLGILFLGRIEYGVQITVGICMIFAVFEIIRTRHKYKLTLVKK